jgi:hypothetical protein
MLLMLSASCVPLYAGEAPAPTISQEMERFAQAPVAAPMPVLPEALPPAPTPLPLGDIAALNAAIPLSEAINPQAASIPFRAGGLFDRERALQCLAEAVYYEARSESFEGQRAVAQVVLNRVRHPAYPGSICGVVYQGPMRAGGGCQFTFTCDGSLRLAPSGAGWARARAIAAAALSGQVFAPVGHATHYHTHQVLPAWAYTLAKVAVIGSHNFYRLQGDWGKPGAFRQRYAGREPSPAVMLAARPVAAPSLAVIPLALPGSYQPLAAGRMLAEAAPPPVNDRLPKSTIREEYRNSGAVKESALR